MRDEEHSLGQKKLVRKPYRRRRWRSYPGFRGMTLREWLPIVIAAFIPILIAFGTWRITTEQGKLENQRAEAEQELAEQRAQDEALQAYLDQMSTLVLEDLGDRKVQAVMRARTLTALRRLDASRKAEVMQFLDEADLVRRVDGRQPVISLNSADLRGANLFNTDFTGAKLNEADLRSAELISVELSDASLIFADLGGASLGGVDLSGAYLDYADLEGADLRGANLRGATLYHADLGGANLHDADLSDAKMEPADVRDMTQQAAILEGATMPNGQKYEEWLKSKGRGEDGENSGTS